MIAIFQFDGVSLSHLYEFLEQGRLPTLARLRERGRWLSLQTPAENWEGATYFSLYSGTPMEAHGLYYPFMWAPEEQRVCAQDDYPAPEPLWDRVGKAGRSSLVVDPYESRKPRSSKGKALAGWQFRHRVTLRRWSVPAGLYRKLQSHYGAAPLVEEVYGRPSYRYLSNMRDRLVAAPRRAAEISSILLREQNFDLVWITCSSSHIAGHWFLDPSRLPQELSGGEIKTTIESALGDAYSAVDEALCQFLESVPKDADLIVTSPSGMGPSASLTHLLPPMLKAVLSGKADGKNAGNSLWRIRAAVPPELRGWVARVLPDRLTTQLTARLEMRGVDWTSTKAFMVPSGDCGYVRLNLIGRERHGIVDPKDADSLLDQIAAGLRTFRLADGTPAVRDIEFVSQDLANSAFRNRFPDLIVHWSDNWSSPMAGVSSPVFGNIASPGWGSGRTGEHRDGAWALIVPGSSTNFRNPTSVPDIMDIAATICSVLKIDRDGLTGQPLLEPFI